MADQQPAFKQSLGLFDSTMIVAGSMIGSGIFIVSADITRNVGSAGWLIAVWLITGFMTIVAAVSYGELSGMFPKAGGQYVYLKEAYNPFTGFLYGWSFFAVIQTATIAAVGVAFSKFAGYFIPALELADRNILLKIGSFKIYNAQIVSILLIIFLTYINTKGIKGGKMIQTTFTVVKLVALFGLIAFGFLIGSKSEVWNANWSHAWDMHGVSTGKVLTEYLPLAMVGAIAASMSGSIFSSDAWNNVTFIAGEMKNPKRNIGLSLFFGTLIVTIIYVLTNVMYVSVLPLDPAHIPASELVNLPIPMDAPKPVVDSLMHVSDSLNALKTIAFANQDRVAVTAANSIFENGGTYVIAALIMVSTFGCNNGLILAGARVYYTMANDGLFFKKTGELNKFAVPEYALWLQCIVASILCLSGKYGDLLDMIAFVVVIFYALTIIGIFILRKKRPDIPRPYKAFGYPVLPAIYILLAAVFCIFLIKIKPVYAGIGLGIVLLGIPLYYLAVSKKKA